jgi:hypothetical protein
MKMRRTVIGLATAVMSLLVVPMLSAPAHAGSDPGYATNTKISAVQRPAGLARAMEDGACNYYDLCVWAGTNFTGRLADFTYLNSGGDPNWGTNFINSFIANNDESAINAHLFLGAYICTGPSYSGQCGYLPAGGYGNTAPTYVNNSESHYWF